MAEKHSSRPAGGREGDFSELTDWTITDIATAPKTAPEGGKVLYPRPDYKSWLESDRSEPIPTGVVRESIEDRLAAERAAATEAREEMNTEKRRELNRAIGEVTIRAFENVPAREKINHPTRVRTEKDEIARSRRAEEKESDTEIRLRRQMKESNKYDNSFSNSRKMAVAEAKANLPIAEVAKQSIETDRATESAEVRAEELYNYYEDNFAKNAPKWASFGVSSLLEKGIINPPTDSLLRSGFWAREEDRIHERIDPENTFSMEAIDSESDLKVRVSKDLIKEKAQELSENELSRAKRNGILHSIYTGARIDSRSGKIVYSVPVERGDAVVNFMKENGLEPDSEKARLSSHNGFIGIVESIKDDKTASEQGFKALDWYFDTFGYKKHMDEFLDIMDAYQEQADKSFGEKLDEYLSHRKELEEWQKQQLPKQDETISALADAKSVSHDEFITFLQENMASTDDEEMFPEQDFNNEGRKSNSYIIKAKSEHPSSTEKCTKAMEQLERIRELDPSASYAIGTVFEADPVNKDKENAQEYALIRFGYNGFNNIIAVHIGNSSRAMFAWRGKTGEDADGWRDHFRNSSIRNRSNEVKRYICRGYGEKGFLALDAQWDRIWKYLNSPDKTSEVA